MKCEFAPSYSPLLHFCIQTLLVVAVLAAPMTACAAVKPIGEFSNMRYTAEHAYGYSVQLWQDGDRFLGLFMSAFGLAGDTPTGLLEDVKFNPSTGALSFTARLTVGSAYLGEGRQEPTRDVFTFKGSLHGRLISGTLTHTDRLQPKFPPETKRIQLAKTTNPSMIEAATYEQWKRQADDILKFRGPKW